MGQTHRAGIEMHVTDHRLRMQTRKEAIALYTSKVEFVQKNLDTLQSTIERKQDNLQSCVGILQMKMQEERAGQASTAGQAA